MAKTKKNRQPVVVAVVGLLKPSGQSPAVAASVKVTATTGQQPSTTVTASKVSPSDFRGFISDLEASPSFITKNDTAKATGPQPEEKLPVKDATTENAGMKRSLMRAYLATTASLPKTTNSPNFWLMMAPYVGVKRLARCLNQAWFLPRRLYRRQIPRAEDNLSTFSILGSQLPTA
ncbi:UNVERIFIED_CONTAM: hypothetical protein Sindi_2883900 [Sesamum indicum]